jgi:hypothetical protein
MLAPGASAGGAAASASGPGPSAGLLPLFHWFLVLLDGLMARWQLSWNRWGWGSSHGPHCVACLEVGPQRGTPVCVCVCVVRACYG